MNKNPTIFIHFFSVYVCLDEERERERKRHEMLTV